MRWKLLRRRLSVAAPRVIVRSHLTWPLRWALVAVMLGFSAAIAMWAFEFGKDIAGLDRGEKRELTRLRAEAATLRQERDGAQAIANTAESLLRTERATVEQLTEKIRQLETRNQALQADLGFFERLLPVANAGVQVRALQAEPTMPGQIRYQMLVMQQGAQAAEFAGRYEVVLAGTLGGRPWKLPMPGGGKPLRLRQYVRVEGLIDHAPEAVLQTVQATIRDEKGVVRASQTLQMP
jgi:hypothetical protein